MRPDRKRPSNKNGRPLRPFLPLREARRAASEPVFLPRRVARLIQGRVRIRRAA